MNDKPKNPSMPMTPDTADDLPHCSPEALQAMSIEDLITWLQTHTDGITRNVIDECASRGAAMVERLLRVIDAPEIWVSEDHGEWWLPLHAIHILGLMESDAAGEALVKAMTGPIPEDEEHPDTAIETLAGTAWPSLLHNKSPRVMQSVRRLMHDPKAGLARLTAMKVSLEHATWQSDVEQLEAVLVEIAALVAEEHEDIIIRVLAAEFLLNFPRERYHELLLNLTVDHEELTRFDSDDVDEAYEDGTDVHFWEDFEDPWEFYDPEHIRRRRNAAASADDDDDEYDDDEYGDEDDDEDDDHGKVQH